MLSPPRILITGSNGFVGKHLIRRLLEIHSDCRIIGVEPHSTLSPFPDEPRVEVLSCDIVNNEGRDIAELIKDTAPDRIFHLAGIAMGGSKDHAKLFEVNVGGSRHVFDAAARFPETPVLFMSTGYVYGHCTIENPAKETDPISAPGIFGPYRDSKAEAEKFARQTGAVIVRAFNMTGPGQSEAFSVPSFAKQIAQIENGAIPPQVHVGNLEAYRDFFDVRDAVTAIAALIESGDRGETYNVCSGTVRKVGDVLNELVLLSPAEIRVVPDPARMRPSELPSNVGDPGKTYAATGWRTEIPFTRTLTDTLDWWREQLRKH